MATEIKATLIGQSGIPLPYVYRDLPSFEDLRGLSIHAVHAFCFYQGKLVIVYDAGKNLWSPPGGRVEAGETIEEATVREVLEESNMRVLGIEPIGYIEITDPDGSVRTQIRSFCIVEPIGPFIADPDGDITEIKLINTADIKEYFDWGTIGDTIVAEAQQRALGVEEAGQP